MTLGKQYRGQTSYQVKTEEDVKKERDLQAKYDHKDAVPIHIYFVHKQIKNVVQQDAMKAYTKVQRATFAAWDEIFNKF